MTGIIENLGMVIAWSLFGLVICIGLIVTAVMWAVTRD